MSPVFLLMQQRHIKIVPEIENDDLLVMRRAKF